jgi:predicted TIM-barrel enzyme
VPGAEVEGNWGGVVALGLADDGVLAGDEGKAARGDDLVPVGVRVAQDVEEKRVVADLRPEKPAFTDLALREVGAEDAVALKATGATTEEATADAIAAEMLEWSLTQEI